MKISSSLFFVHILPTRKPLFVVVVELIVMVQEANRIHWERIFKKETKCAPF